MATRKDLSFREDPLRGKLRFRLRTANNFLLVLAVFVPFAFAASLLAGERYWAAWLADGAAIALLYYAFVSFLDKRAIWMRCPNCRKQIASNTPWVCGSCGEENMQVKDFPFVHRCEKCGIEPKAYQCHHKGCEKLIFLTRDELLRNYAFCINPPTPFIPPTEREIERAEFEQRKRRGEYKLHLTRLDTEVKKAEQVYEALGQKAVGPEGKIAEHRAKRRAKTVSATELYRKELRENAEKYKDDPEMLKWVNEDLEDWYRGGDWERIV